jgi:hypothetical protein
LDQGDAKLEKDQAAHFCREVLFAEPPMLAVFIGLAVGGLDDEDSRQTAISWLNASGYLTTPEAIVDAVCDMRRSDVSIWRGTYRTFVDKKLGPDLTIAPDGKVFLDEKQINNPNYANDRLQWSMTDGNPGDADLTFRLPVDSDAPDDRPVTAKYTAPLCTGRMMPTGASPGAAGDTRGKINVHSLAANETDGGIDAIGTWAGTYPLKTDAWTEDGVHLDVNGVTDTVFLGEQQIYPATSPATASWSGDNNLVWTGGYKGSSGNLTFSQTQGARQIVRGRIWIPPATDPGTNGTTGAANAEYPALLIKDWAGTYSCSASTANTVYFTPDELVIDVDSSGMPTATLGRETLSKVTFNQVSTILSWQGSTGPKYGTAYGNIQFVFDATAQPTKRFAGVLWNHSGDAQPPSDENFRGEQQTISSPGGLTNSEKIGLTFGLVSALVATIGAIIAYKNCQRGAAEARAAADRAPRDPAAARRAADAAEQMSDAADAASSVASRSVASIAHASEAAAAPVGGDGPAPPPDAGVVPWAEQSASASARASVDNANRSAEAAAARAQRMQADAEASGAREASLRQEAAAAHDEAEQARIESEIVAVQAGAHDQRAHAVEMARASDEERDRADTRAGNAEHAPVPGRPDSPSER